MARNPENQGIVDKGLRGFKKIKKIERNVGLGVAAVAAVLVPELVVSALVFSGWEQVQIMAAGGLEKRRAKFPSVTMQPGKEYKMAA